MSGEKFFIDCVTLAKDLPHLPTGINKKIIEYTARYKCINCEKILLTRKKYLTIPSHDGYTIISNCGICELCFK